MILEFPNLDTLRLALTSGLVPAEVAAAPVAAAVGERGSVWVETPARLPPAGLKELTRLGVQDVRSIGAAEAQPYLCWPQILPLQRAAELRPTGAQMPVLLELPAAHELPGLVGEMLRLGNDRQSFRYLEQEGGAAVLLRVIGPPYYSLLRALERDEQAGSPRAYREGTPGVWIELGWTHPLLEWIKPPPGKLLLLRSPRDWQVLPDVPFRDIYEILEFPLPGAPTRWHDAPLPDRLPVPLRLILGGSSEPAELWVLRGQAVEQLEEFIRTSNDQLLARLSFAVGSRGADQAVIVRVRPSRQALPVLVLEGEAYRSYLKLPNLFVPCGRMLSPQLRRSAVSRLLADDPDQVTWLRPLADGSFVPETMPDQSFRPISEWVEYVLSTSHAPLQAWIESAQFDFERFVCRDEHRPERRPRARDDKEPRKGRPRAEDVEVPLGKPPNFSIKKGQTPPEVHEVELLELIPAEPPSELQRRKEELEDRFLRMEGAIDAPERQALWPELARVYTGLDNLGDAAICWANALWSGDGAAERGLGAYHQANLAEYRGQPAEQVLETILARAEPGPAELRLVASFVLDAGRAGKPPPAVLRQLNRVQSFLEQHSHYLPVRVAWLAALALHRLSGGDLLALARTRDRLLARLYQHGLAADTDLPSFLRFGSAGNARFQTFRDWLLKLPDRVRHWLLKVNPTGALVAPGETLAYADLILAFGFARMGEKEMAQGLRRRAVQQVASRDDVHSVLQEAFSYRIEQALNGLPPTGPLPQEGCLEHLAAMESMSRYKVDRLRQYSAILEPQEQISPYRSITGRQGDALSKKLVFLADVYDPAALESQINDLLRQFGTGKGAEVKRSRARIVKEALEWTPRVGQVFAVSLLAEVEAARLQFPELLDQAVLLERALFVAAHFNQAELVAQFVAHLQNLLEPGPFLRLLRSESQHAHHPVMDSLLGECFFGLRKLGMRDTIERLLRQLSHAILDGKPIAAYRDQEDQDWLRKLRALLQVAGGWFYFGMTDRATPIIDEARHFLLLREEDRFETAGEKRKVARAYVQALGQAPPDLALAAIDELLQRLQGIHDNFGTSSHFGLWQLEFVETLVLAIVTDDFAQGHQARRWLDDDEFLIRKRIHHDVQTALAHESDAPGRATV